MQVEMKAVEEGTKTNERFRTEDMVEKLMVETKDCQFLYEDATGLTFMESDTYEQFAMAADILGDSRPFLADGMDVKVSVIDGKPISVELPLQVVCEVVETEPVIKGQTVSSSYKPAILDNGVRTGVPPFVGVGDKIVVATADGSYVERAK
jgi:elongation factor P